MPRRIPDYALQFADFNSMASVGAFIFGFSQLVFIYNVIQNVRAGEKATRRFGMHMVLRTTVTSALSHILNATKVG